MQREQEVKWRVIIEAIFLLLIAIAVLKIAVGVIDVLVFSSKPLPEQCEETDNGS